MADTVSNRLIHDGVRRKINHLVGLSDGTGENLVTKADISTLTFGPFNNKVPDYSIIDRIEYTVQGHKAVALYWDHTTDDVIAYLTPGWGVLSWEEEGGLVDPKSAGGTGDILLSTIGPASNAAYDITLWWRPKQN